MNEMLMTFQIKPGRTVMESEDATACEIEFAETLTVSVWYDVNEKPLCLTAKADVGDEVRLELRSYHISLFVNGVLCDEEWPFGNLFLTFDSKGKGEMTPVLSFLSPEAPSVMPAVTRRGLSAKELRLPGVNVGDCIPYADVTDFEGAYHLFWLYDRHHHESKWHLGAHQWAHASTKDFVTWNEHPMAVGITEGWEGSICTGSVCRAKDRWYAWYAARMSDRSPARMTYAVSDDLVHFTKCGEYFHIPPAYESTSARDPMVFYQDGQYHMLVTTTLLATGSGCLAHLVNDEMTIDGWEDCGVIMAWQDHVKQGDHTWYWQPECPDWFQMGDYYYLVFGIGGASRYGYAKEPYGPFTYPENNIIPCGSVPKSAVLPGTLRRIFMGFYGEGGYAGGLCAVETHQNPDGTLFFEELKLN